MLLAAPVYVVLCVCAVCCGGETYLQMHDLLKMPQASPPLLLAWAAEQTPNAAISPADVDVQLRITKIRDCRQGEEKYLTMG